MKRSILSFLFLIVIIISAKAQFTRYIVKLKNKGNTPYTFTNPIAYLSQRAIDRRTKYSIAIDSTDLPVTPSYLTQIKNVANVTVINVSKWLNSISIQTSDASAITTINAFPFVQTVNGIAAKLTGNSLYKFQTEETKPLLQAARMESISADYYNYGINSSNEIHKHHAEFLHNIGFVDRECRSLYWMEGFFIIQR